MPYDTETHTWTIESVEDAASLAFSTAELDEPRPACLVLLDEERAVQFVVTRDHDDELVPYVEWVLTFWPGPLLLVSHREHGSAVERDDVLRWEEVAGMARAAGKQILDWIVIEDDCACFLSRDAPTPGLVAGC